MRLNFALMSLASLTLVVSGCDRQSDEAAQDEVISSDEVLSDEMPPSGESEDGEEDGAFQHIVDRSHVGDSMPDKRFIGPDGAEVTLAGIAAGRPLLVNLWATWCAPCVAELPALDRIAAASARQNIGVIAVSQDQAGAEQVDPFMVNLNLATIKRYLDPENELGFFYNTGTLPTTILYDGDGKEIARIIGALDWEGEDGQALMGEMGG